MASTFGEIVAHVSSTSDTSEFLSVAEKIVEGNEKSKLQSVFADCHWQ